MTTIDIRIGHHDNSTVATFFNITVITNARTNGSNQICYGFTVACILGGYPLTVEDFTFEWEYRL